jgi:PAS domain S-box-containing protein
MTLPEAESRSPIPPSMPPAPGSAGCGDCVAGAAVTPGSECFNRSVLDSIPAIVAVLDGSGRIRAVNEAWSGFAACNGAVPGLVKAVGSDYLAPLDSVDAASPEAADARAAAEGIRDVLSGRRPLFTLEYPCHSPTQRRWFLMHAAPLRGPGGGAVVSHVDISERRSAEESLRDANRTLRTLIEASPLAVVTLDAALRVGIWNSSAERMFGVAAEEAVGRPPRFLPPERLEVLAALASASPGRQFLFETQALRPDGSVVEVECSAAVVPAVPPIIGPPGAPEVGGRPGGGGVLLKMADVTRRKKAEQEWARLLVREKAAAAEADENRRRFEFLARAGEALGRSLNYTETLSRVAGMAVPSVADACVVFVRRRDGSLRRAAAAHRSPLKLERALRLLPERLEGGSGDAGDAGDAGDSGDEAIRRLLREGRTQSLEAVDADIGDPAGAGLLGVLGHLGLRSCILSPLVSRGRTLGLQVFAVEADRRFGPADAEMAGELARRSASAVDNARLFQKVGRRQRELRRLAVLLSAGEDRQRRKLAQDLHDSVGQTLSLVKMRLEAVHADAECCGTLKDRLGDPISLLDGVIDQMRTLVFDLYPTILDSLGLTAAIRWYAEQVRGKAGLAVSVVESGPTAELPAALAGYLYRAVKELLNNAVKHAGAREACVALHWREGGLRVAVCDDGRGFAAADPSSSSSPGLGLVAMRERIDSLGGEFSVESRPGRGTEVYLDVPLRRSPEETAAQPTP